MGYCRSGSAVCDYAADLQYAYLVPPLPGYGVTADAIALVATATLYGCNSADEANDCLTPLVG